VKVFLFTLALAALSAGMANAGWDYSRCANNNSRACTDARNAFASHHGGVFPEQYSMNHHGGHHYHSHHDHNDRHHDGR